MPGQHSVECAPAEYDPCEGKSCGDRCTICPPGATDCFEDPVENECTAAGTCELAPATCEPPAEYDPCEGKELCEPCTLCPPNDPECVETDEEKSCNEEGQCIGSLPACFETSCQEQAPDACEAAGCLALIGAPAQTGSFDDEQVLGCDDIDIGCGDMITCAIDPDGACFRFRDTCVPAEWEATICEDARCCAPGECQ